MKKPTKAELRKRAEITALTQRITDVYSGAGGRQWDEDNDWPSATELSLIVPVLEEMFGDEHNGHLFTARFLERYEQPSKLAACYYERGIRP